MYIQKGATGSTVLKIQYTLHILGYAPNGLDASFGPGLEGAVKRYQNYYGIAQTGIVTDTLFKRMVADIVPIRAQLVRKGCYSGSMNTMGGDGRLYHAVKTFQSQVGLVADGSVGPATRVRLFSTSSGHRIVGDDAFPLVTGSKGDNVLYLQYGLHILACEPGALDGSFGPAVSASVQRFQRKYGLAVDGSVGPATWAKMKEIISSVQNALVGKGYSLSVVNGIGGPETYNQICAFQKANGLTADGSAGPATWPVLMGTTANTASDRLPLVLGSTGVNVTCFQYGLHICGLDPKGFDGSFGPGMQAAVRSFQASNSLDVDGSVGPATWSKMLSIIKPVQQALSAMGYYTSEVNGVPGELTYQAVKNFQKAKGLSVDGMVGPATKQAMGITNTVVSMGIGTVSSVLKQGSNGSLVRYLQKVLSAMGYTIDIDGNFGPGMEAVIKKFQTDQGLAADGSFGPATWAKLFTVYHVANSGSAGNRLASVAEHEFSMGFSEDNANDITPYGEWYGMNGQPWCAMFVSWCALQANLLEISVPRYAYCPTGKNWFKSRNRYFARTSGYRPKRGDVVFFWDGSVISHTGIVIKCEGNTVTTVEGNSSRMVNRKVYSLDNTYIDGYGAVDILPTLDDPDYHPETPDNPDQVPPADPESYYFERMLALLKAFGVDLPSDTYSQLPDEWKNQLAPGDLFNYTLVPGVRLAARFEWNSSIYDAAQGTVFKIEDGHFSVAGVDFTDAFREVLNVTVEGVSIKAKCDEITVAVGNGDMKFAFVITGREYGFRFHFRMLEEIDAYMKQTISCVVGVYINRDQMHNYFNAEQVAALNYFKEAVSRPDPMAEYLFLGVFLGVAFLVAPEVVAIITEAARVHFLQPTMP